MAIKSKKYKILRLICFLLSLICLGTSAFSVCRLVNFAASAGYFYGMDNFRQTLYDPKMSTDFLYEMGLTYYSIRRAFITYDDGKVFDADTFATYLENKKQDDIEKTVEERTEEYEKNLKAFNEYILNNPEDKSAEVYLEEQGYYVNRYHYEGDDRFIENDDGTFSINYDFFYEEALQERTDSYNSAVYQNEYKYLKSYISQLSTVEYFLINNATGQIYTNSSYNNASDFRKAYENSTWFVSSADNFETVTVGNEFKTLSDMTAVYPTAYRHMPEEDDLAQTFEGIVLGDSQYLYEFFTAIRYGYTRYMNGNSYLVGSTNLFEPDPCTVYLSFDYSRAQTGDPFTDIFENYLEAVSHLERDVAIGIIGLGIWLILVFCLLRLAAKDPINLNWQNKIPGELHFLLSAAIAIGFGALAVGCIMSGAFNYRYDAVWIRKLLNLGCILSAMGCYAFFINWLITLIQSIKGKVFFKNLLVILPFKLAKKIAKRLAENSSDMKKGVRRQYKVLVPIYLVSSAVCWFIIAAADDGGFILLGVLGLIAINAILCVLLYYYAKALDKIRETVALSAMGDFDVEFNCESMPQPMVALAQDIAEMRTGMELAINNAVRDQQTKTELITNVSHDLKTPLTSIITYSDLILRSGIEDETVRGYADVLIEKSYRLKQLIDDLTEASKVSTGNVDLQLADVSLYELAMQAVGENEESLEEKDVEIRFTELAGKPIVHADGQKTYRIFENIISNISKYAMPGTRAYVTVGEKDGYGVAIFKNVSQSPLNIPAEQLMERFVRGDAARTGEGSGLGLSIARDLCELQGGKFEIRIDGDLFTATVNLPLAQQ